MKIQDQGQQKNFWSTLVFAVLTATLATFGVTAGFLAIFTFLVSLWESSQGNEVGADTLVLFSLVLGVLCFLFLKIIPQTKKEVCDGIF
ncbi:MAG: hypothetical protein WD003_01275 [Candidatus Paceibacterota bacterium]